MVLPAPSVESIFDKAARHSCRFCPPPPQPTPTHLPHPCRPHLADIVGLEDGLGVECLSGSGAIASVYSRAFREGFTVTLVSGRTVGIGAYLARLGRR